MEAVLERGREGAPERGFSMAMDSIRSEHDADTLVLLARDESDPARPIRGVLHFVPCYGRSAVSLSFMRRDPGTPNGLTEFMVVKAIELLRGAWRGGDVAQFRGVRPLAAQPARVRPSARWAS